MILAYAIYTPKLDVMHSTRLNYSVRKFRNGPSPKSAVMNRVDVDAARG